MTRAAKKETSNKRRDSLARFVVAAMLCLIIANALYYAISHFEGISQYGDDAVYSYLGGAVLHGTFMESPGFIFSVRLTEAFAVGFFYYVFGVSNFTSTLWNITSYIGLVVVTFLFVKFSYNRKAALLAALLVSIFPLVTKYAVTMGEDIPLAFISSLAILLFLYGERYTKRWCYFFSGFLLVVAWLTSYEAAVAIAFLLLYALIGLIRRKIRIDYNTVFFLYGIAFLFLVVFIYSYLNSGFPFITITENTRFYSGVGQTVNGLPTIPSANTDLNFYIDSMFQYNFISTFTHQTIRNAFTTIYNELFGQILTYEYGLYFYIVIPIAVLLLAFRERRSYFMIFWLVFSFLVVEVGPMHIGVTLSPFNFTYLLAHRLLRFMLILSVPLTSVIGVGLAKMLEVKNRYLLAFDAVIVIAMLAVLYANNYAISNFWYYWQRYPNELIGQAASYIKTVSPQAHVYLESFINNANVGWSSGPIETYLGNPIANRVNISIASTTNCTAFLNNSYVVWAGPPHCDNWVNELNITPQSDIPTYIINAENPDLGYKISNIYYVK